MSTRFPISEYYRKVLICTYARTKIDRLNRKWTTQRAKFKCDKCSKEYEDRVPPPEKRFNFCSRKCAFQEVKKGGLLDRQKRETCLARYGVETTGEVASFREKRKQTSLERYGVEEPMKAEQFKEKQRQTNMKRFGFSYAMSNPDVCSKMVQTMKERYKEGELVKKRYETMKRNNSFQKSRAEDKMHQLLVDHFGSDDVQRHIRPRENRNWIVDFYVKSINTWIQVDGVYWHGLDGRIEEHRQKAETNAHSRIICYKWNVDREQEAWFASKNMNLIRISDLHVKKMQNIPSNLKSCTKQKCECNSNSSHLNYKPE